MITGRDVVIGRGVLTIGLVSVSFAIIIGYATVHAERNDRCGKIVAQIIDGDAATAFADAHTKAFDSARPARP